MQRHPHFAGFRAAAEKEYKTLEGREIWKPVLITSVTAPSAVLPVMWVFTYKFDEDGYLLKYKARLVVRGDLY
jgi:hypothetical protein